MRARAETLPTVCNGRMRIEERELVLRELGSSEARLLALVEGLTPQQWNFRESPKRWSIAENIEHCVLFEDFILGAIMRSLDGPAEPQKRSEAAEKEHLVLGLANGRNVKLNAREVVHPVGGWPDRAELIAEFRRRRARTIGFAEECQADLRGHFFAHIMLGDLDCYQWLLVLSRHAMRHALQIEEIKADRAYPVS
jgi:hypothetical protein